MYQKSLLVQHLVNHFLVTKWEHENPNSVAVSLVFKYRARVTHTFVGGGGVACVKHRSSCSPGPALGINNSLRSKLCG